MKQLYIDPKETQMKFRALILMMFMLLLSMMLMVTHAQEEALNNNACYAGGTMEGMCDSDYMWIAGWIKFRLENGLMTDEQVPELYEWLIDEDVTEEVVEEKKKSSSSSGPGCVSTGIYYADFGNSNFLAAGADEYDDDECTNSFENAGEAQVYAANATEAAQICVANGLTDDVTLRGGNVYYCANL